MFLIRISETSNWPFLQKLRPCASFGEEIWSFFLNIVFVSISVFSSFFVCIVILRLFWCVFYDVVNLLDVFLCLLSNDMPCLLSRLPFILIKIQPVYILISRNKLGKIIWNFTLVFFCRIYAFLISLMMRLGPCFWTTDYFSQYDHLIFFVCINVLLLFS